VSLNYRHIFSVKSLKISFSIAAEYLEDEMIENFCHRNETEAETKTEKSSHVCDVACKSDRQVAFDRLHVRVPNRNGYPVTKCIKS